MAREEETAKFCCGSVEQADARTHARLVCGKKHKDAKDVPWVRHKRGLKRGRKTSRG